MTEQHVGWDDLAARLPGSAASVAAAEARAAAPVRTVLARLMGVHTDERAWRLGAAGERRVGRQLERLMKSDPRWRCLHAIPVGRRGADIDHLVIGPGGVFTLNAKHHPGARLWVGGDTFMVNGVRQPYVRNSTHEASLAGRLLSAAVGHPVTVTGVVVPVGAQDIRIKQPPTDVVILPRRQLRRWLASLPQTLPTAIVDSLLSRLGGPPPGSRKASRTTDHPPVAPHSATTSSYTATGRGSEKCRRSLALLRRAVNRSPPNRRSRNFDGSPWRTFSTR